MCGLTGIIAPTPRALSTEIAAMNAAIRHRGPDGDGFALSDGRDLRLLSGADTPKPVLSSSVPYAPKGRIGADKGLARVAFGHRRLAIIDLAPTGHQPMTHAEDRFVLVYNGEIYNYLELHAELVGLGHSFISASDTEVLMAAYRQWGDACLSRLNGMFAFLLFDRQEQRLFAARDRFGVKPLYCWRSPEGLLAFASEIKAFTSLPGWKARLNAQRAYDYLNVSNTDHTSETLFDGVIQLRGGEFIHSTLDDLAHAAPIRRWYELKSQKSDLSFEAASARFRELLSDSVGLRLRADVPVGTGLSGGLDSSSIVCLVNGKLREIGAHELQNTFSACAHLKQYDEREFIEAVVGHTAVKAHYTFPDLDDLSANLAEVTWHQDEPFAGASVFAEWCVFDLVGSTPVKVTLDGHGADELLAGYHAFFGPHLAHLMLTGRLGRLSAEMRAAFARHGYSAKQSLEMAAASILPDSLLQSLRRAGGRIAADASWMNLEALGVERYNFLHRFAGRTTSVTALSRAQLLTTSLPPQLHWCDRDSMAHSIESRAPFLDYRLVEFALGLPDDYKLAEGETKRILRSAMKGVLPEKIRKRQDKMGFVTPEAHWITVDRQAWFLEAASRAYEQSKGVLNSAALDRARSIIGGKEPFNRFAWRLISFGAWMECFDVELAS